MRFPVVLILATLLSSSEAFAPFQPRAAFRPAALRMADEVAQVEVRRLPDSAVEIDIPVPGSATKAAYDKVCTELSKTITIKGFRKGSRIPPQVLEASMAAKGGKNALKVQAINELLTQLVERTLKEQSLDPIGQATLKIPAEELANAYKPGEDLMLPVRCDVWPDIQWKKTDQEKPYIGLKGKYSRKPFDQEKLDVALRDLKERYVTLETVTDTSYALQMGDSCFVNMNGFMATPEGEKGEPLPNAASGDRVEVVLGPGRYMEGLVEGLDGATVGETRIVSVTFPVVRHYGMHSLGERSTLSYHQIRSWTHTSLLSFLFFRNFVTRHWLASKPFSKWRSWRPPSVSYPS
jgi:trigger factor